MALRCRQRKRVQFVRHFPVAPVDRYGAEAESKYGDAGFDAIVDDLEKNWANPKVLLMASTAS
jgi:hypothetical protein